MAALCDNTSFCQTYSPYSHSGHAPISNYPYQPSDRQIINDSQQRAKEKREAAERDRQKRLDKIEQQFKDERERERAEQLARFKKERDEAEAREKKWLDERRRTEEEAKREHEEFERNWRQRQQEEQKKVEAEFWRLANDPNGVLSQLKKIVDELPDTSSE
jgi:hypothetical protein